MSTDSSSSREASDRLRARDLATGVLGIDDEDRLAELDELDGLLDVIRTGIENLQATRPEEPPPTTVFDPAAFSRDFWRGRPTSD